MATVTNIPESMSSKTNESEDNDFGEQGLIRRSKEMLKEETENKVTDVQDIDEKGTPVKANKQSENEEKKDDEEEKPQESVDVRMLSSEVEPKVEGNFKKDETETGEEAKTESSYQDFDLSSEKTDLEACHTGPVDVNTIVTLEKGLKLDENKNAENPNISKNEEGNTGDEKEWETLDGSHNASPENKDEATGDIPQSHVLDHIPEDSSRPLSKSHVDATTEVIGSNGGIAQDLEDQEKEQELNVSKSNQSQNDVTSSEDAAAEDIKETTTDDATTVACFEEQGLTGRPNEDLKEETENKEIDVQDIDEKANEQCENEAKKDEGEQKTEESVDITIFSSEIEQEVERNFQEDEIDAREEIKYQTEDAETVYLKDELKPKADNAQYDRKPEADIESGRENVVAKGDIESFEGGTFLQTLSVPMVTTDKTSNTAEGSKAATTQDQASKMTEIEPLEEGKSKDNEEVEVVAQKDASAEEHQPNTEDHMKESQIKEEGVMEAIAAQTEDSNIHSLSLTKGGDKDIEEVMEICNEDESMGVSSNTKTEAVNGEVLQGMNYHGEGREHEYIKTMDGIEEDNDEIKSSNETEEKTGRGLLHAIISDACISTQIQSKEETTESEEKKNEEEAIESTNGRKENSSPVVKEACEETGSQKVEAQEGEKLDNSSIKLNEKTIAIINKDEEQEKEQELDMSENNQGEDDVMNSQDAAPEDIKVAASNQDATIVAYFEEQEPTGMPKEIKEETKNKEIDEKGGSIKANEQCENESVKDEEQKPQESVDITAVFSEIKQEVEGNSNKDEADEGEEPKISETESSCQDFNVKYQVEDSETGHLKPKDSDTQDDKGSSERAQSKEPEVLVCSSKTKVPQSVSEDEILDKPEPKVTMAPEETVCKEIEEDFELNENRNVQNPEIPKNDAGKAENETECETQDETQKRSSDVEDQEKEQEISMSENNQVKDDVTSSQDATSADVEETLTSHNATTISEFEEQGLAGRPKDILKEEIEDKEIDAQDIDEKGTPEKTNEQRENGAKKDEGEEKPQGSANTTVFSLETEQEVEKNFKKDETDAEEKKEEAKISKTESSYQDFCQVEDNETGHTKDELKPKDDDTQATGAAPGACDPAPTAVNTIVALEEDFKAHANSNVQNPETSKNEGDTGDKTVCKTIDRTQNRSPEDKDEATNEIPQSHASDLILKDSFMPPLESHIHETAEVSDSTEAILQDVAMSYDKAGSPLAKDIEDETLDEKEDKCTVPIADAEAKEETDHNETQVEKELEVDTSARKFEYSESESHGTATKEILESVEYKFTEQDSQESKRETNMETEAKLEEKDQTDRKDERSQMKDEIVLTDKMSTELVQSNAQNVEEIQVFDDEITKKDEELYDDKHTNENSTREEKIFPEGRTMEIEISKLEFEPVESEQTGGLDQGPTEISTDLKETTEEESQGDIVHSSSLETSTKVASDLGKSKTESEYLSTEDFGYVQDVQITGVVPMPEDTKVKEDCLISATAEYTDDNLDKENEMQTREISHEEKTEKETEIDKIAEHPSILSLDADMIEKNLRPHEQLVLAHESMYGDQINETTDQPNKSNIATASSIKTNEIPYSDPIPVGNPEVTEAEVDGQIRLEDLQAAEDPSCKSKTSSSIKASKTNMEEGIEQPVTIIEEVKNDSVDEVPKEEKVPAREDDTTLKTQVNLSNTESTSSPEQSGKLPTSAHEFVSNVQSPGAVPKSEDSKAKEECIVLATAEYEHEDNLDEEHNTVAKEISSEEIKDSKKVAEHPSIVCLDADPIEQELERSSEQEKITGETRSAEDLYPGTNAEKTIGESCSQDTIEENVKQPGAEAKWSHTKTETEVIPEENPEPYVELERTTESMTENINKTIPRPEISEVATENNVKYQTVESHLNHISDKDLISGRGGMEDGMLTAEKQDNTIQDHNETIEDVILAEEVPVEIKEENGRSDSEEQTVGENSCTAELKKISATNQKDIANETSDIDPVTFGNHEVTEMITGGQIGQGDLKGAEDLSSESNASSTVEASKMNMKEGNEQPVTIIEEVKHDSVDEAPTEERNPAIEDATTMEPQVNLSNTESEDTPTESEKLPIKALESVYDVQNLGVVRKSADSEVKAAWPVWPTPEEVAEYPSIVCPDASLIEEELGRSSKHENATSEGRSVEDPYQDSVANGTSSELCTQEKKEENDKQPTTTNDEVNWSETNREAKSLTQENLQLYGESNPTLESVFEDQLSEAKSSIDGNRDIEEVVTLTPENKTNSTQDHKSTKDVVLTEEVSNSDPIPVGDTIRTEAGADVQIGHEELQAREENNRDSRASSTAEAPITSMVEGVEQPTITEEARSHSVVEAPKEERIPALEDGTTLEPEVDLLNIESTDSPSESEKSTIRAVESISGVQSPEVVPKSEDSKVKEECLVLAEAEYKGESTVDEDETITNEILNEEKTEQTANSEQVVEDPSIICADAIIEEELERSSELENITGEVKSVEDPYQHSVTEETVSESSSQEIKEENVKKAPIRNEGIKSSVSDTITEAKALTEENLEPYGELITTSELMTKDQVNEATHQPEKSDIVSENIKHQTLESWSEHACEQDLIDGKGDIKEDVTLTPENQINSTHDSNEKVKAVILTEEIEQVPLEIEKEKERNEVKEQISDCRAELQKTSALNQKELADEIPYSDTIEVGKTEVTEVRADSETKLSNLQVAEDLSCESKASFTTESPETNMQEGTNQPVTIIGEVKIDSIHEAPTDRNETIRALEDATALEPQVNFPNIEPAGSPSEDQDIILREGMPQTTQETPEEEGSLISRAMDTESIEEKAIKKSKEASNIEFEKIEKVRETTSEIQTPESILRTEINEESPEAANDATETLRDGLSSEKLLKELQEIDAREDVEVTARGEDKAIEESNRDAVAEVTVHESLSQEKEDVNASDKVQVQEKTDALNCRETNTEDMALSEEKLAPTVACDELKYPLVEDQTTELVLETDKTKTDKSSISKKDLDTEITEEEFTETFSEDQRSVKDEGQGNLGAEKKEIKNGNEPGNIKTDEEVEAEMAEESKCIKENINEKASCMQNQLITATDEVCQIEKSNSSLDEMFEAESLVEATEDLKLTVEDLNVKAKTFTVTKGSNEDMKQGIGKISDIIASEYQGMEKIVAGESIKEADANKEKSISTEKDLEVGAEESKHHGDMHILEEKATDVFEITSEGTEIITNGKEVPATLTEKLQEASCEMLPEKHDPQITTTIEQIEDARQIKGETFAHVCLEETLATSTKEVACLSMKNTGEHKVVSSEIDEGKQIVDGEIQNKPRMQISNTKLVDSPSDVEIGEQGKLRHSGTQESPEDNTLLSQDDKEIVQGEVDINFKEAPIIEIQKHDKVLDYTTKVQTADAASNENFSEIEQPHLDTKEATSESINQVNQSEQTKKVDESIQSEISSEKTTVHMEATKESLVMSATEEDNRSNYPEDILNEQECSGERMHQEIEVAKEPLHDEELFDKVEKPALTDIQEDAMAKSDLLEEGTEEKTDIKLSHKEKRDETYCKGKSTEAPTLIEDINNCEIKFIHSDMDAPAPIDKCTSTTNLEVQSADPKVPPVMDAAVEKADHEKDLNSKIAKAYESEKELQKEDMPLKSTGDGSKITVEVSAKKQVTSSPTENSENKANKIDEGIAYEKQQNIASVNQKQKKDEIPEKEKGVKNEDQIAVDEPSDLPLTRQRSMELDAHMTHGTTAAEGLEISQKYVADDFMKVGEISQEVQKQEVSACSADKQLPNTPCENESTKSKLLTRNIDVSQEQGEVTAKSLNVEAEDSKAAGAPGTQSQFSNKVLEEKNKMSDGKEKSATTETAKILFADMSQEPTKGDSQVAENLIEQRELPQNKEDRRVEREETGDGVVNTDDEQEEEEEDNEDNEKMVACSDTPVTIEAPKDMEFKVHKKSNNILSGVGSKVKHSIAKVKKAITGKSSHPKPPSPKQKDEVIT